MMLVLEIELDRPVRGHHEIDADDLEDAARTLLEKIDVNANPLSATVRFK